LRFTENYENPFKDLPENLFLSILNKPTTNYVSNQHNISNKKILNTTPELLTQESQDDMQPQEILFKDDLPQDDAYILPHDKTEDNEILNVKFKVKELYSLMDRAKIIIEKNTQMPNAEQWINSIDKNFNSLRKMVDDCERFDRKQKMPNTWEGRNHNTFWV